jgi:soluble P-type ATPase
MLDLRVAGMNAVSHLVLDFNGTMAADGRLLDGVADRVTRLARDVSVHVVTGNTFGTVADALAGLPCSIEVLPEADQAIAKRRYVEALGASAVACVGNGRNDVLMMQVAALAIAVLQGEGASPQALMAAHVVAPGIRDALDLLLHPLRLKATLRP